MGRKKTYDRDALIGKSMEMFRDHGFAVTSTQMLVEGLGVNRFSVYAEFGTKQALFNAALERYDDKVVGRNFAPLEAQEAGIAEVRELQEFFASASEGPVSGRGCLLCNTAVEYGPDDPGGEQFVQRYFERLTGAFCRALDNAHRTGELRTSVNPREEAAFFTAAVLGLFVMLRAAAPPKTIKSATQIAINHLEALRADA